MRFELLLTQEMVKQKAKDDLTKAKAWLTEAHERLRNHELHGLADAVYGISEKIDNLLRRLS
jgi:hypothetical protein